MFSRIRIAILVGFLSLAPQAYSLEIILNDIADGGSPIEALLGFEAAASYWESLLSDDVTVRLDVGFEQLAPGVLGSTGSTAFGFFYSDVRDAMLADINSDADVTATESLTDTDGFQFLVRDLDAPSNPQYWAINEAGFGLDFWNAALSVNTANAKALGLFADDGVTSDGNIRFSSDFTFDFDPSDGIDANAFDFIGVAAHEIGHALGFVSGVDILDFVSQPNGPLGGVFDTFPDAAGSILFSTLDLFRYSDFSVAIAPFLNLADPLRDFTFGDFGDIFFSLDGGTTNLATFSTGSFNGLGSGGGRQASHWEDGLGIGLLDPTAARGESLAISKLDLLAFDAIGWDVVKVPEPGTLGLFVLGLALVGLGKRKQQSKESSIVN